MNALDHNPGVEVLDLRSNTEFLARPPHQHDALAQLAGMQRLAHAFTESPDGVLQELADIAVELCGAESAGISLETSSRKGSNSFSGCHQWRLLSFPQCNGAVSPDALWCLSGSEPASDTSRSRRAFRGNGTKELPPPITDGILIPWEVCSSRGTIWVLVHDRTDDFDHMDYSIMQMFSDFAAMAVRNSNSTNDPATNARCRRCGHGQWLAHQINNPLQKLANSIFLADTESADARVHIKQASHDLRQLSSLVQQMLALSNMA
jgi:hypothetical protein